MKILHYIRTGNKYGEILVFTSKKSAREWARRATKWTADEIEKNIVSMPKMGDFFPVYPDKIT